LADKLFELFDEYAVRYARGEQPDPVSYLERAGDESTALAQMLDRFLQSAPAPAPDKAAVLLMQAWLAEEPPLRELRVERGLRVEDVVGELADQFDIDLVHRGKLRRYFQRLERGALDLGRVDPRVLETLATTLHTSAATLRSWATAPRNAQIATTPAYRSEREPSVTSGVPSAEDEDWNEVDELFVGPRSGG
jgi:hypothetical protein